MHFRDLHKDQIVTVLSRTRRADHSARVLPDWLDEYTVTEDGCVVVSEADYDKIASMIAGFRKQGPLLDGRYNELGFEVSATEASGREIVVYHCRYYCDSSIKKDPSLWNPKLMRDMCEHACKVIATLNGGKVRSVVEISNPYKPKTAKVRSKKK